MNACAYNTNIQITYMVIWERLSLGWNIDTIERKKERNEHSTGSQFNTIYLFWMQEPLHTWPQWIISYIISLTNNNSTNNFPHNERYIYLYKCLYFTVLVYSLIVWTDNLNIYIILIILLIMRKKNKPRDIRQDDNSYA